MRYWRNIDPRAQVADCTQRGNSIAVFHRRVSGTRSYCKCPPLLKFSQNQTDNGNSNSGFDEHDSFLAHLVC